MSQNTDFIGIAFQAMKQYLPFLFALCFHEYAHGWVARLRGDRTAEIMGRLTLNPAAHADLLGTVILPLVGFVSGASLIGWAKPVPVDERNLKNPKTDMFWVALAGPLANLLLALIGAIGLGLFLRMIQSNVLADGEGMSQIFDVFKIFIGINIVLAIFNLLPVHPLDGAKVLARFLPDRVNQQIEAYSTYTSMILLMLFLSGGMRVLSGPIGWVAGMFLGLAQKVASV
jgi:Zn-dependent protease